MRTTKLYVGSIPSSLTEAQIAKYFQTFSQSCEFSIVRHCKKVNSKGSYGFVTVPLDAVSKILSTDHVLGGYRLMCEEYLSGEPFDKSEVNSLKRRRLFIRNLKRNVSEEEIYSAFSIYGPVESVSIIKSHSSSKNRSFGYVTFRSEESSFQALREGSTFINNALVYVHLYEKGQKNGTSHVSSHFKNSTLNPDTTFADKFKPQARCQEQFSTCQNPSTPQSSTTTSPPTTTQGLPFSQVILLLTSADQLSEKKPYLSPQTLSKVQQMHVASNLD